MHQYVNGLVTMLPVFTPIIAVLISIIAFCASLENSRNTTRISIQQAIFKSVYEKSQDCNVLWDKDAEDMYGGPPAFSVVSELVISTEVIDRAVHLFRRTDKKIGNYESDFYYLFWKQLRPDLRGLIIKAKSLPEYRENQIYRKQIDGLHTIFNQHFENRP